MNYPKNIDGSKRSYNHWYSTFVARIQPPCIHKTISLSLSHTHSSRSRNCKKNKQLAHPSKFELAAASAGPINALLQFFFLLLLLLLPLVPSLRLVSAMPQLLLLLQLFCNAFTGLQKKKKNFGPAFSSLSLSFPLLLQFCAILLAQPASLLLLCSQLLLHILLIAKTRESK